MDMDMDMDMGWLVHGGQGPFQNNLPRSAARRREAGGPEAQAYSRYSEHSGPQDRGCIVVEMGRLFQDGPLGDTDLGEPLLEQLAEAGRARLVPRHPKHSRGAE